jgi:hypothetical protein
MRIPSFPVRSRHLWRACALFAWLAAGCVFGAATTPNPGLKCYYPAPGAPVLDVAADVIVYGGTSGGVVAAVQAARMSKSVAFVVFGRHVGGMTAGGLTETDGVSSAVVSILDEPYDGWRHREFVGQENQPASLPGSDPDGVETVYWDPQTNDRLQRARVSIAGYPARFFRLRVR